MVRIPRRLRAEQNTRPRGIIPVSGVQSIAGAEVADARATPMCVRDESRGDIVQSGQLADGGAGNHAGITVTNEADHRLPVSRKPELYSRIENLVCGRIPAISQNQRS